jgi:hypothetical protein
MNFSGSMVNNDLIVKFAMTDGSTHYMLIENPDNTPDTTNPTIAITAPTVATTYATSSTPIALAGTASDDTTVTQVTWSNDRGGSGAAVGTDAWDISSIVLQPGINIITVIAYDAAGNTGTDTLTVTYTPADTTSPTIAIVSPTPDQIYATSSTPITLVGTAADNIAVTQVTWSNDRGGSGVAIGTSDWTAADISLQSGANVITVTAYDAAGNTGTDTLTVTYTLADTVAPTIVVTSPTSSPTYATTSTPITIGGTASDNVGVTQVTWSNDRGGSGIATGTDAWDISSIVLQPGANVIAVTAYDAAGNTGTDTLTVTYALPDTILPTIAITSPTSSPTYLTTISPLAIGGTASDNIGVTQVTWINDRGGSGTASGTTAWTISNIPLQPGANIITVTAYDAAGNAGTDTLTVTYAPGDTINPTIAITAPTAATTYATNSTPITLAGTASDNVAVIQVTWSNDRGGSGAAVGTTNWTTPGVVLQPGANVITVTAYDAAGNTGTDTLTVTYTPRHADYLVVNTTGVTTNPSDRSQVTGITISNSHSSYNIVIATMTISWSGAPGGTKLNTIRINGVNVWTGAASSGAVENITDFTLVAGFGNYPMNYLDFSRVMTGSTVNITFTMLDGTIKTVTGLRP